MGLWNGGRYSELQLSILWYPIPLFREVELTEAIASGGLTGSKTGDAASDPRTEVRVNTDRKVVWLLVDELFACPWNRDSELLAQGFSGECA
jgi:hypothetical protein